MDGWTTLSQFSKQTWALAEDRTIKGRNILRFWDVQGIFWSVLNGKIKLDFLSTETNTPPKAENLQWVSLDFKTVLKWTAKPSEHKFTVVYTEWVQTHTYTYCTSFKELNVRNVYQLTNSLCKSNCFGTCGCCTQCHTLRVWALEAAVRLLPSNISTVHSV